MPVEDPTAGCTHTEIRRYTTQGVVEWRCFLCAEPFTQSSKLDAFQKRVADLGYDNLDALVAVFERNLKWLDNVCSLRHQWRAAPAGDYTTPHQVCRACGNARPTPSSTATEEP